MVRVRADHDILVLEYGISARQNSDDVARRSGDGLHLHVDRDSTALVTARRALDRLAEHRGRHSRRHGEVEWRFRRRQRRDLHGQLGHRTARCRIRRGIGIAAFVLNGVVERELRSRRRERGAHRHDRRGTGQRVVAATTTSAAESTTTAAARGRHHDHLALDVGRRERVRRIAEHAAEDRVAGDSSIGVGAGRGKVGAGMEGLSAGGDRRRPRRRSGRNRQVLEVRAVVAGRLESEPSHLALDVRGRADRVWRPGFAAAHGIRGVDVESGHQVARRDRRDCRAALIGARHRRAGSDGRTFLLRGERGCRAGKHEAACAPRARSKRCVTRISSLRIREQRYDMGGTRASRG